MSRIPSLPAVALLVCSWLCACNVSSEPSSTEDMSATPSPIPVAVSEPAAASSRVKASVGVATAVEEDGDESAEPRGLQLRIEDVDASPPSAGAEADADADAGRPMPPSTGASTEPLDDARVEALLARIDTPVGDASAPDVVQMRTGSLPPPRTGVVVRDAFPAPPSQTERPTPQVASLEVLRFAPEGEVQTAPFVSVTFSQPMVPLAGLDELDAIASPVRLQPLPTGRWRWLGTTTLIFEPDVRMPAATEYQVEVPAGTRSLLGGELVQPVRFAFATPAPRLLAATPNDDSVGLSELHVLRFDQAMDAEDVLARFELRTPGFLRDVRHTVRPATRDELLSLDWVRIQDERGLFGNLVGFYPVEPLPRDTAVEIVVPEGLHSAEGPRVTRDPLRAAYHTYPPLRLVDTRCSGAILSDSCSAGSSLRLRFSNILDEASAIGAVHVEPAIDDAELSVEGNWLVLSGRTRGVVRYTVRVDGSLRDRWGQTLGDGVTETFLLEHLDPQAYMPGGDVVVLDPFDAAGLDVSCVNVDELQYQVFSVTPDDYLAYAASSRDPSRDIGQRVLAKTFAVEGERDLPTKARLDLSPALPGRFGHVIVRVPLPTGGRKDRIERRWVQRTALAVDVQADAGELLAWVTSLRTGEPVAGVAVRLLPEGIVGTTDANGLCALPMPPSTIDRVLVASHGEDSVLLPGRQWCWRASTPGRSPRFYVLDDRGTYKPGETVSIKGWVRVVDEAEGGDLQPLEAPETQALTWTLNDARNAELASGTCALDAHAGFALTAELPDGTNLGFARLSLALAAHGDMRAARFVHRVSVQEFRRPEFEVSVTRENGTPLVGTQTIVSSSAHYYTGSGLPGAPVAWSLSARPGSYAPPGWERFSFGAWTPWWRGGWDFGDDFGGDANSQSWTFASTTDVAGDSSLRLHFDGIAPPRATSLTVEAAVTDSNRQRWAASTALLVHPADEYVGLAFARPFCAAGEEVGLDVIVAGLDGEAVPGREIELRLARRESKRVDGTWREVDVEAVESTITSGDEPVRAELVPTHGGRWRLTARVHDGQGRVNESTLELWVSGARESVDLAGPLQADELTLVPSGSSFAPGETATFLVSAPFDAKAGLLTVLRSGLVRSIPFTLSEGSAEISLPIEAGDVPSISVQVEVAGSALRGEPPVPRPAFASALLALDVPPEARRLQLEVSPERSELLPGDASFVDVIVRGADGEPVPDAQVALIVADEAVLALSRYTLADPLATMYLRRPDGTCTTRLRDLVLVAEQPEAFADELGMGDVEQEEMLKALGYLGYSGGESDGSTFSVSASRVAPAPASKAIRLGESIAQDDDYESGSAAPAGVSEAAVAVRNDFSALALFRPDALTDGEGRVRVPLELPDSLTRYRVMAVAADRERRFGLSQASLTARLPLMLRPSLPRFMNYGDVCALPLLVQNGTDAPMTVDVAVSAGLLAIDGPRGLRVEVPAHDRVELRFSAHPLAAGTARVAFVAVDVDDAAQVDAARVELPVWTPATTEAFATYGVLDDGLAVQPVSAPRDAYADFGGLDLSFSSTAVSSLTDAVIAVSEYPYGCSEQRASRILAASALKDVLAAFEADGLPSPDALRRQMRADLDFLAAAQRADGGFGFWDGEGSAWPFLGVHVASALLAARDAGYEPDDGALTKSLGYLRAIERHLDEQSPRYEGAARHAIVAYALAVRRHAGDDVALDAARYLARIGLDAFSLESVGWLLSAMGADARTQSETAQLLRHVANRAVETPSLAGFASIYVDGRHLVLAGTRRTDGVVLDALMTADPKNVLIPKVVAGLQAHKAAGHWGSTQDDVFVLLALGRYFAQYESLVPDFVARTWLGDDLASEVELRGRTTESHAVRIPMAALVEAGRDGETRDDDELRAGDGTAAAGDAARGGDASPSSLLIAKDGPGRLYYRLGLSWAPKGLQLSARDEGFAVSRSYEAVDDPSDVMRDDDGTWRVRLGATVRVRLQLACDWRRHHVALADPLPAGFEALNSALAVTGSVPKDEDATPSPWWWWRRWYEHENLRDERAEAFTSTLWPGSYEYSYVCRATTPGTFVVPPTKAEEMYSPEVFGRGASGVVIVE